MATPGSPVDQLIKSNEALATYYSGVVAHLETLASLPEFASVIDQLEYDELLRRAEQDANGGASVATATAVEEVHNNAAHLREHSLVTHGKAELYLAIRAEYTQSSDYHKDRASLLASLLRGETRVAYLT